MVRVIVNPKLAMIILHYRRIIMHDKYAHYEL